MKSGKHINLVYAITDLVHKEIASIECQFEKDKVPFNEFVQVVFNVTISIAATNLFNLSDLINTDKDHLLSELIVAVKNEFNIIDNKHNEKLH